VSRYIKICVLQGMMKNVNVFLVETGREVLVYILILLLDEQRKKCDKTSIRNINMNKWMECKSEDADY
jgi:hypothetical protein